MIGYLCGATHVLERIAVARDSMLMDMKEVDIMVGIYFSVATAARV